MKRQYVGSIELIDGETGNVRHRVFLLKPCERGVGLEPVVKYSRTGKMYFPVVKDLPMGLEVGKTYDVICDEQGNIVEIRK